MGLATIQDQHGNELVLNTLYIPGLGVNLISSNKLSKDFHLKGLLEHPFFTFVNKDWKPAIETQLQKGVYVLKRILY